MAAEGVIRAGLVQLCSTPEIEANLARARARILECAREGASWALLPENAPFLGRDREKLPHAEAIGGPITQAYQAMAREAGVWLSVGSIPEVGPDPQHTRNTQLLLDPAGEIVAIYRKIHLFDADTEDASYRESGSITAGDALVSADVVVGEAALHVGLSICYDLRFPELYRALVARGAQALTVPSAFTVPTGRAHWLALLQARAIENQCFVLAPDQTGEHCPGRASFGHTVAYDPWGRQLGVLPEGEGVLMVSLDLGELARVRRAMPCQQHRKFFYI